MYTHQISKQLQRNDQKIDQIVENYNKQHADKIDTTTIGQTKYTPLSLSANAYFKTGYKPLSYMNTEDNLKATTEIIRNHDSKKHGEIKNLSLNIIYNTISLSELYLPKTKNHLDTKTHKKKYRAKNRQVKNYTGIKNYINTIMEIYQNDINKTADTLLHIQQQAITILEENARKYNPNPTTTPNTYIVDIEKVSTQYNALNKAEKETILTMPTMFTYNLLIKPALVEAYIDIIVSGGKSMPIDEAVEIFRKIND